MLVGGWQQYEPSVGGYLRRREEGGRQERRDLVLRSCAIALGRESSGK